MGWLRENWFDILIFAVFVAVAVGMVSFLTDAGPINSTNSESTQSEAEANEPTSAAPEAGPVISVSPGQEAPAVEPENPEPAPEPEETTAVPLPELPTSGTSVVVGAFGDPANAIELAAQLRSQGYQVFTTPVAGLTRVAVGPYNDPAEAQRASEALAEYQPRIQEIAPPNQADYVAAGNFSASEAQARASELESQGLDAVIVSDGQNYSVWVGPVEPGERESIENQVKTEGNP